MKILLLSCSTGEGHNHCALAVKEALDARGHETSFLDMLHMFGDPGPLSFDKILNRISTKAPDVFGMMYHAGAMYSATGVTSPVYMANIRHARQLNAFIRDNGYDAVVCSHLFPMETLTFLRRWERCDVKCCGILSDYACIPFLAETDLDAYFLPHSEVRELCIQAGMPAEKLIVSGMPVAARFLAPMDKAAARAAHRLDKPTFHQVVLDAARKRIRDVLLLGDVGDRHVRVAAFVCGLQDAKRVIATSRDIHYCPSPFNRSSKWSSSLLKSSTTACSSALYSGESSG